MNNQSVADVQFILTFISTLGAVITPILLAIFSLIFANQNKKQERLVKLEENLRSERVEVYNKILEPFIIAATPELLLHKDKRYINKTPGDAAGSLITTPEYKSIQFKLFLIGSDEVIQAFDKLMYYFYSTNFQETSVDMKILLPKLSELILSIRKGVGNEKTKINKRLAINLFVKDADSLFGKRVR